MDELEYWKKKYHELRSQNERLLKLVDEVYFCMRLDTPSPIVNAERMQAWDIPGWIKRAKAEIDA